MDTSSKFVLRNLPLAPRLVLSLFLASVGCGYVSALVQLHFQHAKPGNLLPGPEEAQKIYHGATTRPQSHIERLLEAPEETNFNGTGQMRAAFTTKSDQWKKLIRGKSEAELATLKAERANERLALLEWIRAGATKENYERDNFALSASLAGEPFTKDLLVKDAGGNVVEPHAVAIRTLIEQRCVDCHAEGGRFGDAAQYPLDTYDRLKPYLETKPIAGGMSLTKLAQTTHVHLLAFSMLYGLTGLIFAFTSYPVWTKVLLAPLPLAAQLADVSCWWLARFDPRFTQVIMVTGGLVAGGLFAHIALSLFNMYGRHGKKVVIILLLLAAVGGFVAKSKWIDPYLEHERAAAVPSAE